MAAHTLGQLHSSLTAFPATFASGDTIVNTTKATIVAVLGQAETVNGKVIVNPVDGSDVYVRPGDTSAAIVVAADQGLYLRRTDIDMSTTVDAVLVVADLPTPA